MLGHLEKLLKVIGLCTASAASTLFVGSGAIADSEPPSSLPPINSPVIVSPANIKTSLYSDLLKDVSYPQTNQTKPGYGYEHDDRQQRVVYRGVHTATAAVALPIFNSGERDSDRPDSNALAPTDLANPNVPVLGETLSTGVSLASLSSPVQSSPVQLPVHLKKPGKIEAPTPLLESDLEPEVVTPVTPAAPSEVESELPSEIESELPSEVESELSAPELSDSESLSESLSNSAVASSTSEPEYVAGHAIYDNDANANLDAPLLPGSGREVFSLTGKIRSERRNESEQNSASSVSTTRSGLGEFGAPPSGTPSSLLIAQNSVARLVEPGSSADSLGIPSGYVQLSEGIYVPSQFLSSSFGSSSAVRSAAGRDRRDEAFASASASSSSSIVLANPGRSENAPGRVHRVQERPVSAPVSAHNSAHFAHYPSPAPAGVRAAPISEYPLYPLPYVTRLTSPYGYRVHPIRGGVSLHEGVDLAVPIGTPVLASLSGTVQFAGWLRGYGYTVILQHQFRGGSVQTLYAHLSAVRVNVGQSVSRGELIALSGNSGGSTGPHLHFEIRQWTGRDWVAVDINQIIQYAAASVVSPVSVRYVHSQAQQSPVPMSQASQASQASQLSPYTMRVALLTDASQMAIASSSAGIIRSFDGRILATLPSLESIDVVPDLDRGAIRLSVRGQTFLLPPGFFLEPASGGIFAVNNRWYRGRLLVSIRSKRLIAVNWVDLEEYLLSVVGSEMYPSWGIHALKAQAIAARSYALVHRQRPHDPPWFDVYATERHQAYRGVEREFLTTSQAVSLTRGMVLTNGRRISETLYAANQEIVDRVHRGYGMSQEGAASLAVRGASYDQILRYYYPSDRLARIY